MIKNNYFFGGGFIAAGVISRFKILDHLADHSFKAGYFLKVYLDE